ncbi:MAG: GNAT family N-acetyltransferase [Candidatus Paceibacterota bacterium]
MEINPEINKERGGKNIDIKNCTFSIIENPPISENNKKRISIILSEGQEIVGAILIKDPDDQELVKQYIQLRVIDVKPKYQGGNAANILYRKAIEYAESFSKKLLFDNELTEASYKSFKKLDQQGYKIIENPEIKFDGKYYTAGGNWVLRVERIENTTKNIK